MANQLLLILMQIRHSGLNLIILNGAMQLKRASSGLRAKMFRFHWAFCDLVRDKSLVWWFWILQKVMLQANLEERMGLWVCGGSKRLVRPWARQVPGFAQGVPEHPWSWFSHGWAGFYFSWALPLALHAACAATAAGVAASCGFS